MLNNIDDQVVGETETHIFCCQKENDIDNDSKEYFDFSIELKEIVDNRICCQTNDGIGKQKPYLAIIVTPYCCNISYDMQYIILVHCWIETIGNGHEDEQHYPIMNIEFKNPTTFR